MNTVVYCILNQIKSISILLYPVIPETIEKNFKILGLNKEDITFKNLENLQLLKPNNKINKTLILFKKIEDDN